MTTNNSEPTRAPCRSPSEIAEQMFAESPYVALRYLKCRYCDGELTIAGRVPSYYLKQLAQVIVQQLDGVERISNIIDVSL